MKHLTQKQSKVRALTAHLLERMEESKLFTQMELNYIHSRFYEVADHLEWALESKSDAIEEGRSGPAPLSCPHKDFDQVGYCTECGHYDGSYDRGYG